MSHAAPCRPQHLPPSWPLRWERGGRAGGGLRAGSSWGPLQRPRLGLPERASVGRSVPPHRGCGGCRLRLLICPRSRGEAAPANQGSRCADGQPVTPPPALQLSSPYPPTRSPQSGGATEKGSTAGWGDSRDPCSGGPKDPVNEGRGF
jgi:hypothetical protein